jgi:hypothetical protein
MARAWPSLAATPTRSKRRAPGLTVTIRADVISLDDLQRMRKELEGPRLARHPVC